jgi:integrase
MVMDGIQKRTGPRGVSYRVRIDLPPDPVTGERRRRSATFRTKREAEAARIRMLADIERGTAVDPSKLTLGAFLADWLPRHRVKKNLRPSTYSSYEMNIRQHITPTLGQVPLQRLTPKHIADFYHQLQTNGRKDGKSGGLSAQSVKYIAMILKQALKHAVRLRLVVRNVAEDVDPPKVPHREMKSWNEEQARYFLSLLEGEYYGPLLLVDLATGLRRGELLALRWQDIDLEQGYLRVRQALTEVKGKVEIGPPKTKSALRELLLPPEVVSVLHEHLKRQVELRLACGAAWQDRGLIFSTPDGAPIHPRNFYRRFIYLIARSELPRITLHGLRHTFASLVYGRTKDMLAVSRALGHASPSTTANIYAHLLPDAERKTAEAIGGVLFGQPARDS